MKSKMNLAPDVGFSRIRVFLEQAGPIMERARGEVAQTWPLAWPPLPKNVRARARGHGQPAIPPSGARKVHGSQHRIGETGTTSGGRSSRGPLGHPASLQDRPPACLSIPPAPGDSSPPPCCPAHAGGGPRADVRVIPKYKPTPAMCSPALP